MYLSFMLDIYNFSNFRCGTCPTWLEWGSATGDTWRARGYEGPTTVRPLIEYLHHPTSSQVPKSSDPTQTRQTRHHLSNHRRAQFLIGIGSSLKTSPVQLSGRILGNYQIRSQLRRLNRYLRPTYLISGHRIGSYSQQIGTLRLRPTTQIKQLSKLFKVTSRK